MHLGLGFAFAAGVLTFFAGCLIPVLPAYLGYLGGLSTSSRLTNDERPFWLRPIFLNSLIFAFGFIIVFCAFSLAATVVSNVVARDRMLWQQLGGVLIIVLAILNTEIIQSTSWYRSWQFPIPRRLAHTHWGAFILGLVFGFAWTPCIGPTLATILFLTSFTASYWYGVVLLIAFGVGLALPFILLGLAAQWIYPQLQKIQRWAIVIRWISSCIMVIVGFLLLTNQIGYIAHAIRLSEAWLW